VNVAGHGVFSGGDVVVVAGSSFAANEVALRRGIGKTWVLWKTSAIDTVSASRERNDATASLMVPEM
jgi:hypothetical protein